jgi:carbon-monoxide dehydrogenase large subunit
MNAPFDPSALVAGKFAVGQPVSRKEDPVLLRGEGRYADDLNRANQLYAVMVRSRVAHGTITSIDVAEARGMPGVRAVILAKDPRKNNRFTVVVGLEIWCSSTRRGIRCG